MHKKIQEEKLPKWEEDGVRIRIRMTAPLQDWIKSVRVHCVTFKLISDPFDLTINFPSLRWW